jgi:endoglucanase
MDIYRDYAGEGIVTGSYAAKGFADFYSSDAPSPRKYALRWGGCDRYGSVTFGFARPLDLSTLAGTGYALEFMARVDKPGSAIEIRFRSAVSAPGEKPWRMSRTLDATLLPADGAWHRIRIPLSEMRETGAWDNAWFEPAGLFSWNRVSVLEFVAEGQSLAGFEYSFADIAIVK